MPAPTPVPWQVAALPPDAVLVGHVHDAWGVRGWVRVHGVPQGGAALAHARRWFLAPPQEGPRARVFDAFAQPVQVQVRQLRRHGEAWVARLDGVDDRTVAESLRGAQVYVARADFPPTDDPDEFYWVDLIGLQVVNRAGLALGVVRELLSTGPHAVLCLEDTTTHPARQRLIPFVSAYVDRVDLAARRITVDWQPDYDD
ncbi:MAG: ribosome maturation factor RimM [Tepidimonas sp.]|uniref:ribosome maturation factor RimM n=1 Tax=Tepidimonas sp. TaxID=2002775 RepID=UPI00298F1076|nr:ribosome maturation factor RimM [Tepidimonas sp.]MDW8335696.1 ribosome maturation factor RimM [Tepidimonas sp.]